MQLIETGRRPDRQAARSDKRYVVYKVLPFAFQVIKFNHAQPPTNDVNFRLAVQAALDMEEIMAISYPDIYQMDGAGSIPARLLHQGGNREVQPGRSQRGQGAAREIRATRARSSPSSSTTFAPNIDTATVVQQRLKEIGVNVELSVADWPTVSKIGFTPKAGSSGPTATASSPTRAPPR